jgi:hypothetical protein
MNKTVIAVRRAVKEGLKVAAGAQTPHKYQAGAKVIVCSHCGADGFQPYGPFGATFGGYGLECCNCAHIEYFGRKPKAV